MPYFTIYRQSRCPILRDARHEWVKETNRRRGHHLWLDREWKFVEMRFEAAFKTTKSMLLKLSVRSAGSDWVPPQIVGAAWHNERDMRCRWLWIKNVARNQISLYFVLKRVGTGCERKTMSFYVFVLLRKAYNKDGVITEQSYNFSVHSNIRIVRVKNYESNV